MLFKDFGSDYVVLIDDNLGLVKKISFRVILLMSLSIHDESLVGVGGKIFAGLYRTDGKLWI